MSDSAPDRFATWLSTDIAPSLRRQGFAKTGSSFHRRGPEGCGIVNVQKSQFGSRHEARFTINLGVTIDRWWNLDHETDLASLTAEILPLLVDRALPRNVSPATGSWPR